MSDKLTACPIWGTSGTTQRILIDPNDMAFNSFRADGWYIADKGIARKLGDIDERVKAHLTTWLIDQRQLGEEMPRVDEAVIEKVSQQKGLSEWRRADRLLFAMKQSTSYIGQFVAMEKFPYLWLAHSESLNHDEVEYLTRYLTHQGWLLPPHRQPFAMEFQISVDGYAHLAELDAANSESDQAFVAMWFDSATNPAWKEGIEPAVEAAGYKARRIDRKEFTDRIDDEVVADIRRSRFLVADFTHGRTGARGSVYYEAGFAHGLNITVIFSCQKDCLNNIHFDLRQYNCIEWEKPENLKDRLVKRICATIGDGPHKA